MSPADWAGAAGGALAGLLLVWAALVALLWRASPRGEGLAEALRLLPDLLRLVARLARDRGLPLGVRLRVWGLLAYLACPVDLVPDVVPVVGYADDAVLVALTLRSVVRRAGVAALQRHWPGTPDGLSALLRLAGPGQPSPGAGSPTGAGSSADGGPPSAGAQRADDLDDDGRPADGAG